MGNDNGFVQRIIRSTSSIRIRILHMVPLLSFAYPYTYEQKIPVILNLLIHLQQPNLSNKEDHQICALLIKSHSRAASTKASSSSSLAPQDSLSSKTAATSTATS